MVQGDFGEQTLKAGSLLGGSAAPPLVLVDHHDPFPGPAEQGGIIGQSVLALPRFLVLEDLLGTGLADVDERQFAEMPVAEGSGAPARCRRSATRQRVVGSRTAQDVRVAHASPPAGPGAVRGERPR